MASVVSNARQSGSGEKDPADGIYQDSRILFSLILHRYRPLN